MFFLTAGCITLIPRAALGQDPKQIPVWEYYTSPPFVIDAAREIGISFDFAQMLTEQSQGRYEFVVELMPLARIINYLETGEPGVVFWANNHWFDDPDMNKYSWSDTIFRDESSVISPKSSPIEYTGTESLVDKEFVGIRGYYYVEIDPLVEQGIISRRDAVSEEAAIKIIATERGDATIFSQRAALYYQRKYNLANSLHFSSTPHYRFNRYVLIQPALNDVKNYINTVIASLDELPAWQSTAIHSGE